MLHREIKRENSKTWLCTRSLSYKIVSVSEGLNATRVQNHEIRLNVALQTKAVSIHFSAYLC